MGMRRRAVRPGHCAALVVLAVFAFVLGGIARADGFKAELEIAGVVSNDLTENPIEGVYVELSAVAVKALASTFTDAAGQFSFTVSDDIPGPFDLSFTMSEYQPGLMTSVTAPNDNINVLLVPMGVTTPEAPLARSGPHSVYLEWPANPEFNLKGYNIYRTEVDETFTPLADPVQMNGALETSTEYNDETVVKGTFYIYQIEAVSGADRPSAWSEPSDPPVKGQWLTVFFPEVATLNPGFYLWAAEGEDEEPVIPVCSRCAYDVSTSGMSIVAWLPRNLIDYTSPGEGLRLDVSDQIEPSGITAGMAYVASLGGHEASADIPSDRLELRVSAALAEARSLYGAGALFHMKYTPAGATGCGDLELVEDFAPFTDGVRIYDNDLRLVEVELENGTLCDYTTCTHGDANGDGYVDEDDATFINKLWVGSALPASECTQVAGDINLDKYVDAADATLLLRWLNGYDITPPRGKAEDLASTSFLAGREKGDAPQITIASASADPGDEITIPVTIESAEELTALSLAITFPDGTGGLEFVSATPGDAFAAKAGDFESYYENDGDKGIIKISASAIESLAKSGEATLVNLTFKAGDEAGGDVPVVISQANVSDTYGFTPRHDAPGTPNVQKSATVSVSGGGTNILCGAVTCMVWEETSRAAIPNAAIQLSPGSYSTVYTDADGIYTFACLSPGSYSVIFSADGYASESGSMTVKGGAVQVMEATLGAASDVPQVQTQALLDGVRGVAYSDTLAASGGTPPYTWALESGSLPSGLLLDAGTGTISGIPAEEGDFPFRVRVTDAEEETGTADLQITVSNVAGGPQADFSADPDSGTAPLPVAFADESTPGSSPITSWAWDFGDGATSTAQNPSHTYESAGAYTVSLTVTTDVGSSTETKDAYVNVSGSTACFGGTLSHPIKPEPVTGAEGTMLTMAFTALCLFALGRGQRPATAARRG